MKSNRHKVSVTAAVVLGTLLTSTGAGQMRDQSPSQLIAFLTYQSDDRRGKPMTFSCGVFKLDREAAKSLALIGEAAIPSIVEALDSIEKHGDESKYTVGAGWLLSAFAKIQGTAAYPHLRQMIGEPKLSFSSLELDTAIALSLGLTSYVSASRELIPIHPDY
jgi:hypothetical protein